MSFRQNLRNLCGEFVVNGNQFIGHVYKSLNHPSFQTAGDTLLSDAVATKVRETYAQMHTFPVTPARFRNNLKLTRELQSFVYADAYKRALVRHV